MINQQSYEKLYVKETKNPDRHFLHRDRVQPAITLLSRKKVKFQLHALSHFHDSPRAHTHARPSYYFQILYFLLFASFLLRLITEWQNKLRNTYTNVWADWDDLVRFISRSKAALSLIPKSNILLHSQPLIQPLITPSIDALYCPPSTASAPTQEKIHPSSAYPALWRLRKCWGTPVKKSPFKEDLENLVRVRRRPRLLFNSAFRCPRIIFDFWSGFWKI